MKTIFALFAIMFSLSFITASAQTTVQTKRGWSQPKKGAVIGGLAGAATGAIISKPGHKGSGALIGGAVGAGGGYLYGKRRQNRHPRTTVKRKVIVAG